MPAPSSRRFAAMSRRSTSTPARNSGSSTSRLATRRKASRTRPWRRRPRPGPADGGSRAAADRCGTEWPTIPTRTCCTVGTGNGAVWSSDVRNGGETKPLDNLYIASIVAVDADTGRVKWHYQCTPGDEWDYDAIQHLLLADVRINNRNRKVDHAGEQERILLRARSHERRVHLGLRDVAGQLGDRHRCEDRPAEHPSRRVLLLHPRHDGVSRCRCTTRRRCRSIPAPA